MKKMIKQFYHFSNPNYKVNSMLLEDTPNNYIDQLVKQVLSQSINSQRNNMKICYINFNNNRKKIDRKRVDTSGNTLTSKQFKQQALNYFQAKYSSYQQYANIVDEALDDYIIVESYFNY